MRSDLDSKTFDLVPVKAGRWRQYRLAMRLAWRDIRRHRGRSILIVLLIVMPSFGLSAAATFGQSLLPNAEETIATQLGQTQAKFVNASAPDSNFGQSPISDWAFYNPGPNLNGNPVELKTIIPQNYRLLSWRQNFINVAGLDTTNRIDSIESDVLDPAFYGKYSLLHGRAATAADEALASPGLGLPRPTSSFECH